MPQEGCDHYATTIPRSRAQRKALRFWGFAVGSFPIDFLETLRWDINAVLVYLCKRASLASLLGWNGGGVGGKNNGHSTPAQGSGTIVYRHLAILLKKTPPENTSVASDKVLITMAQRTLILCTGPKGKIGDNLSKHNILWSQHPDFGPKNVTSKGSVSPVKWG